MKKYLAIACLLISTLTYATPDFDMIFKTDKSVIAAIMIEGEYETQEGKEKALNKALRQLEVVHQEGVDSILYEFRGGGIMTPPMREANFQGMVEIMREVISRAGDVVIGVEILWHFPEETIRLAKECGAKFVRIDFFSDDMIADGTRVPIDPEGLMAYKRSIGAEDVLLMTDIQVKYADMVDPSITMTESAARAESLGSNAVVVSGKASGSSPGSERVRLAREGVNEARVVIGSGFSVKNAHDLLFYANAAIVGTSISTQTGGVLVPEKVRELMNVVKEIRMQE